MSLGSIRLSYEYFNDPDISRPIFNGKIYIGVPDQDPKIVANQLTVTARQEGQVDVPIPQPIRTTAGGNPVLNGNVVELLVDGNYAIEVTDSNDVQKFLTSNVFNGVPIIIGDDHNLLGNRGAVGAHDTIYPRQFDTFSDLLAAAFSGSLSEVTKAETLQHTQGGFGGSTYIKDGTSGTASTGDELKFFDSAGLGWTIVPVDGALYSSQFGGDPTGAADSTVALNALMSAVEGSTTFGIAAIGAGTFTTTSSVQIPSGDGIIIRGSGHKTVIDSSSAGTEFNTFSAPSSVAKGLIFENMTILTSLVGESYAIDTSLCRNASTFRNLSIGKSGGTFAKNGIFCQAGFYVNFYNIQFRELSGIGFHAQSLADSVTGVNGVILTACNFNGCKNNVVLDAIDPFTNLAFTLLNCTLENSVETCMTVKDFESVMLINCYFEGNNPTASAGEATMISMDDSTVNILGGLYKDTSLGSADALPFETINSSFVHISDNTSITEGNKTFFHGALLSDIGIIRAIDFEASYRDRYADDHTLDQGRSFVTSKLLTLYSEMTTVPMSGRANAITVQTDIAELDFNTTQTDEIWMFDVIMSDVSSAATRGGYTKFSCVIMKRGATFNNKQEIETDIFLVSADHADLVFTFALGVMTIAIDPFAGNSTGYRFVIGPITTGRNDRLSTGVP